MRRAAAVLVALVAFGWAAPASAAPASVSYSVTLDQAAPALGDVVTFTTSGAASLRNPRVVVQCYQSGVLVYGVNGAPDAGFKLGGDSSPWVTAGGPADCTARLADYVFRGGKWSVTYYAETSFAAAG